MVLFVYNIKATWPRPELQNHD